MKKRDPQQSIVTYTGRRFWPLDPDPTEVDIKDIAHALSNLCRYTGHTRKFYSVAQHSVIVSTLVPEEDAMWGLLHDASEAYLADIAAPVKRNPKMLPYKGYEARLEEVIGQAFNLPWPIPATVKAADLRAYATERRDLMPPSSRDGWPNQAEPLEERIEPWWPEYGEAAFLRRFYDIKKAAFLREQKAKTLETA